MSDEQTTTPAIGIKETQEAADLVVALVKGFSAARADGKWDVADIQHLLPAFAVLGPALESSDQIGKEVKDLDAEEIKAIAARLLAGMAMEEGKLKVYVEEGFNVLVSVFKIVKAK